MQAKAPTDLEGLDISSLQTITDENKLFATTGYLICRAYGKDHSGAGDSKFLDYIGRARARGVPCGGYYFGTPFVDTTVNNDTAIIANARVQAQQFIDKLYLAFGSGNTGDITPFLDVEEYSDTVTQHGHTATGALGYPKASGMTAGQLLTWIKAFRDYFYTTTNRRLGFYSNRYFLTDPTQMAFTTAQLQEIADMPLWLAEYDQWYGGSAGNVQPANLGGWDKYVLWQYAVIADASDHGVTHGTNEVDHNRTKDISWLLKPPLVTNWSMTDNYDGTINVSMTHPTTLDYIGTSVYVNNAWAGWISKGVTTLKVTGLTKGQTYNVKLVTEDTYHDFTHTETRTISLTTAPPTTGGNEMARKTHGVTTETTKRFIVDAGAVFINLGETDERLLGATRGGNSFTIEQDIKIIEIDGVKGAMKGARRVIESNAKLVCNLLELSTANIMLAIAGATSTNWTDPTSTPATNTHDEIRRTRNLSDLDYVKNVALVGKVSGSAQNVIILLYNALSDEGFELSFEDREEGVLELTFTGHYDPALLDNEPWAIRYPKPAV
jgi:GH25 family lysozyme M1 (1,4-beta-N-acetylmuramidase)